MRPWVPGAWAFEGPGDVDLSSIDDVPQRGQSTVVPRHEIEFFPKIFADGLGNLRIQELRKRCRIKVTIKRRRIVLDDDFLPGRPMPFDEWHHTPRKRFKCHTIRSLIANDRRNKPVAPTAN